MAEKGTSAGVTRKRGGAPAGCGSGTEMCAKLPSDVTWPLRREMRRHAAATSARSAHSSLGTVRAANGGLPDSRKADPDGMGPKPSQAPSSGLIEASWASWR